MTEASKLNLMSDIRTKTLTDCSETIARNLNNMGDTLDLAERVAVMGNIQMGMLATLAAVVDMDTQGAVAIDAHIDRICRDAKAHARKIVKIATSGIDTAA